MHPNSSMLLVHIQKSFSDDICPFSPLLSFYMAACRVLGSRYTAGLWAHSAALSPYEKSGGKGNERVTEKMGLGESLILLLSLLYLLSLLLLLMNLNPRVLGTSWTLFHFIHISRNFEHFPESVATVPPFSPIEGQKWFDQISSQWESQKNRLALIYFGKIQFLPPCIWNLPFMSTTSVGFSLHCYSAEWCIHCTDTQ